MCPNCNGLGRKVDVDLDTFLDLSKSLNEGAILFPDYAISNESAKRWIWGWSIDPGTALFDLDKKLADYTDEEMATLLHSPPRKGRIQVNGPTFEGGVNFTFEGIVDKFTQKYILRDVKTMSERTQKAVAPYMSFGPCPLCKGTRLSQTALRPQDQRAKHR